ncbi:Glycosyl transferase family 2 [Vibrio chagasii]|nr:Glycosyl transferase family 2 [Vibrio chagasii]CAH7411615.1 Glycosyl transferase family 2 [Vibrio chagasii]CAH7430149.1 Glycosyl transferase family 2 [Vibrio chagasii]
MSRIKFSIIIPYYNAEDFLEETIFSILQSNYSNFEIILVDDGSTDSSYELCLNIKNQHRDRRIILLNQNNQGPNVARNLALENAVGEYVLFIDADDLFDSDIFLKLEPHTVDYDYICYGIDFFDDTTKKQLSIKAPYNKFYNRKTVVLEVFDNNILLGICWNKCISLRFLNENNIRFEPDKMHGRDILFSRECAVHSNRVLCISDILIHSRYRKGSFSRSFGDSNIFSAIDLAKKHLDKFEMSVGKSEVCSSIIKHFNYILILSSFRSLSYQDFRHHYHLIENAKEELEIKTRNLNFKQQLISIYLCNSRLSWIISRFIRQIGYKPY